MDTGVKQSKGKLRWSLLPWKSLESVTRVLTYGAITKYAPDNWKKVPHKAPYADAIIRHWTKYFIDGEEFDSETGESHMAHLVCNALFLIDDREHSLEDFQKYLDNLLMYPDYVQDLDLHKFD